MDSAASHADVIPFATAKAVLFNHSAAAVEARSLHVVTTLVVVHDRAAAAAAAMATHETVSTAKSGA